MRASVCKAMRWILPAIVANVCLLFAPAAFAEQEMIGPISIVGGQPIDMVFPNEVKPEPHQKVLQFTGMATNPITAGTAPALLTIGFDYLDPATGGIVDVMLPGMPKAIPSGTHQVDAGPLILDFCPQEVSIHFELDGEIVELEGIFDHTCVTIPEPSAAFLGLFGLLIPAGLRRRRR